ncbi:MAG: OmpA family protein [Saprospiraceae bacterium]|nr:OmpA family protein [Saprospiraceae bacterium]
MKKQYIYISLTPFFLLLGCVSQKKYNTLILAKEAIQKEYATLRNARNERNDMADSLFKINATLAIALQDVDDWKGRYLTYAQTNEQLNKELDNLKQQNQTLTETTINSNDRMKQEISDRMKELDARERELRRVENSLQTKEGTIDGLKKILSENEFKIKELSDTLKVRDAQMMKTQQTIADILTGGATNELTMRQTNGKVYLTLSEALLFAKGKTEVTTHGIDVLRKLANALIASPDLDISIEGHSDSEGSIDAQWQISTAKAVSVAKILIGAKVEAKRIIASGRSAYQPFVPNNSEVNKAKNRRVEVVISPNVNDLYRLIKEFK